MSQYHVMVGPLAVKTIKTMPTEAVIALRQRLDELALAPSEMRPSRKPESRTAVFGLGGEGMLLATVSDEHQWIIVNEVFWVG